MYCLTPRMEAPPEGAWICSLCENDKQQRDAAVVATAAVPGGANADVLADVAADVSAAVPVVVPAVNVEKATTISTTPASGSNEGTDEKTTISL